MTAADSYTINHAVTAADISDTRALFTAYTDWLGLDLTFQDYSNELANLPGQYGPPTGALLLARGKSNEDKQFVLAATADGALGCVALRPKPLPAESAGRRAELKRLYTTTASRGLGLGKALVRAALEEARKLGYDEVVLDTLPTMHAARKIYKSLGFEPIEPYYETPLEGTEFLRLQLMK